MMMIAVLGPLVVTSDGRPFRGKAPRKGRALLAYLALAGQPVSRERLADLLWPYQSQEQARHSLRNCLLELRKQLGPARGAVGSDFNTCWVEAETDLRQLLRLSEGGGLGELGAAIRLIRGELLDGLDITSEPWLEWLERERERVIGILVPLLTRYSGFASGAGLHDEAIATARQLIRLNNLNEESHRRLMRVLAAAGQRGAALQQFNNLERLLRDELGVSPDAASCALRDELRRDRGSEVVEAEAALEPRIRIVPRSPAVSAPAMTGRWRNLGALISDFLAGTRKLTRPQIEEIAAALIGAADLTEEQGATIVEQRATIAELRGQAAAEEIAPRELLDPVCVAA